MVSWKIGLDDVNTSCFACLYEFARCTIPFAIVTVEKSKRNKKRNMLILLNIILFPSHYNFYYN